MQQGLVWTCSGMKPAIGNDNAASRESINFIGGYGGVMATNPFDDPRKMSTGEPGHGGGVRAAPLYNDFTKS
jgi:NAD(P)H dehydrogenase (quinone)